MTPPEWAPADQAALAELQATGSCRPFRKEYWRKDGSRVPVEVGAEVPDEVTRQWTELDATHDSPAVRAWRSGKLAFFADPATIDTEFPHLAAARMAAGTGSCLAVPLFSAGKVTGVLSVTWPEPRLLGPAQQQFLAAVAGYVAQALTWARQFEAEHAVAHQLQQAMIRPVGNADSRVEVNAITSR